MGNVAMNNLSQYAVPSIYKNNTQNLKPAKKLNKRLILLKALIAYNYQAVINYHLESCLTLNMLEELGRSLQRSPPTTQLVKVTSPCRPLKHELKLSKKFQTKSLVTFEDSN